MICLPLRNYACSSDLYALQNKNLCVVIKVKGKTMNLHLSHISRPARNLLLGVAAASGILTMAALSKTPGETLSPVSKYEHKREGGRLYLYDGNPEIINFLESMPMEYNRANLAYIESGLKHNVDKFKYIVDDVTMSAYENVIDPITDKPVLPATATVLAILGLAALPSKKED